MDELEEEIKTKKDEYEKLDSMSNKDMWRNELDIFEEKYNSWKNN